MLALLDTEVNTWRDVARRSKPWAPATEDLWDTKAWSTAIRDQDDYGPFGTKGQFGIEGPPPPWVQQAREAKARAKKYARFDKLRPGGSGASTAREPRQVSYSSEAKESWEFKQKAPITPRHRRFANHVAVQNQKPMRVSHPSIELESILHIAHSLSLCTWQSLHAMGVHHDPETHPLYRVT